MSRTELLPGIRGWLRPPDLHADFKHRLNPQADPDFPRTWELAVIQRNSRQSALVFQADEDGCPFFLAAGYDAQVRSCFVQLHAFGGKSEVHSELLWLAFVAVRSGQNEAWIQQLRTSIDWLNQNCHELPRLTALLARVQLELAKGRTLTAGEILGDLLHEEE